MSPLLGVGFVPGRHGAYDRREGVVAREKPLIYRRGPGSWILVRERFGFLIGGARFEEFEYPTWRSAVASMTRPADIYPAGFNSEIHAFAIAPYAISGGDGDWRY